MDVTDQSFDQEVLKSDKPVLIDFWAPWCGPCQIQGLIIEEVGQAIKDKAKVLKLNVDENPQIVQKFGIMSIPTLIIFNKGMVVKQFVGVQGKDTLITALNALNN